MCKPTYHLDNLFHVTNNKYAKDSGKDLRRTILIDHLRKKLKCKLRRRDKKMARNFEMMRDDDNENMDTEDILELNGFYDKLKSMKMA